MSRRDVVEAIPHVLPAAMVRISWDEGPDFAYAPHDGGQAHPVVASRVSCRDSTIAHSSMGGVAPGTYSDCHRNLSPRRPPSNPFPFHVERTVLIPWLHSYAHDPRSRSHRVVPTATPLPPGQALPHGPLVQHIGGQARS